MQDFSLFAAFSMLKMQKPFNECIVNQPLQVISDGTRNRNRESEISKLFLVSESGNFDQISDNENDSLEFVCLIPKFLLQIIIKSKYLFDALKESV